MNKMIEEEIFSTTRSHLKEGCKVKVFGWDKMNNRPSLQLSYNIMNEHNRILQEITEFGVVDFLKCKQDAIISSIEDACMLFQIDGMIFDENI